MAMHMPHGFMAPEVIHGLSQGGKFNWGSFGGKARDVALGGLLGGVGTAVAGGVLSGAGAAIEKIHDALTKRRDFREMMSFNPHLQEAHDQDPKRFNQMYTTLRTFNPGFAKDPLVAGTYMDRMWQSPEGVGGMMSEALLARDKMPSVFGDTFHKTVLEGVRAGTTEQLKHLTPEEELRRGHLSSLHQHGLRGEEMYQQMRNQEHLGDRQHAQQGELERYKEYLHQQRGPAPAGPAGPAGAPGTPGPRGPAGPAGSAFMSPTLGGGPSGLNPMAPRKQHGGKIGKGP